MATETGTTSISHWNRWRKSRAVKALGLLSNLGTMAFCAYAVQESNISFGIKVWLYIALVNAYRPHIVDASLFFDFRKKS